MKIKWWGHACFLLTSEDGRTILTDPYNEEVNYQQITDRPDIVTVSHDHFDHNAVDLLPGDPVVVKTLEGYEGKGVKIQGIFSYHDQEKGKKRGENIIYLIDMDGKKICHLGDLGHPLQEEQLSLLTGIDILMIPVGGTYTIDAEEAYQITQQLGVPVVIPMHYKTELLDFPITGVEEFTGFFARDQLVKPGREEMELGELPQKQTVYLLNYQGKN